MNRNDKEILVQKIRTQYTEKSPSALDELKALDRRVKRPADIIAYLFGTVGALVLGIGMCLAMEVIGSYLIPGIAIGAVGIMMVSFTYSIHKAVLAARRKKYGDEILALSESILAENKND